MTAKSIFHCENKIFLGTNPLNFLCKIIVIINNLKKKKSKSAGKTKYLTHVDEE